MASNTNSSPGPHRNILSVSFTPDTNHSQKQTKESFATRLRQTFNSTSKSTRQRKISLPDLNTLNEQSQKLLFHAVELVKNEDSQTIVNAIDETRNMLKQTYEEFKHDQEQYKKQLESIVRNKEAAMERRKENAIPLSMFMRQKRDIEGLADLRPNSGMNTTYQAHFEALLTTDQNPQQHPTDKAAVIRYIRRRERRRRAEENRKHLPHTTDLFEKQTAELIEEMDEMDTKFEHERQRQNNLLHSKINKKKTVIEANTIIDQAHEAHLARKRVEQTHRDKIEVRVSTARQRTTINVRSHSTENERKTTIHTEKLTTVEI